MGSNKKTIMPADVFDALDDIEYPEFKDLVQLEFKSTHCPPAMAFVQRLKRTSSKQ